MIFGEEDSEPQGRPPPQHQQVRLDTSRMKTAYANFFVLAGTRDELTLYLGANSPMPGMKEPVVQVSHRLLLLPASAKRLAIALQQAVKSHEDRFGPIELPPPPQGPRRRPG